MESNLKQVHLLAPFQPCQGLFVVRACSLHQSTSSAASKLSLQLSGGFANKPDLVINPNIQCFSMMSIEMKQFLSNRRRDPNMNWFECSMGWEQELERTGASGWRVSSVNDRFEMSTRQSSSFRPPELSLALTLEHVFLLFRHDWCSLFRNSLLNAFPTKFHTL